MMRNAIGITMIPIGILLYYYVYIYDSVQDHYVTLGVRHDATNEEIHRAFR